MRRSEHAAAFAAAVVLVISMGFSRFAFTGLYPLMVTDHQITVSGGSYAASANYAGYLIGALLVSLLSGISARKMTEFAVICSVITLGLLAFSLPEWLIITIRGFSGAFSAIAMVSASHWLIHDRKHHGGAPALYAGVGVGILASAELIAFSHSFNLTSQLIWLVLALATVALAVLSLVMISRVDRVAPSAVSTHTASPSRDRTETLGPTRLVLIYGLAGFGYIITATYLPLIVKSAIASVDPVHVWAAFGLAAAPSCFAWHAIRTRFGTTPSLMANLLLQAIGVVLPILHTPSVYIVSAFLVGGTFMGTVTIAMPAGRQLASKVRFNMLAVMTASFGVGQIIGPLVASFLYGRTHSFDLSLVIAGGSLLVAAAMCLSPRRRSSGALAPAE
ncbi:YbfB/YjiJ family MFS transporter [Tardiphaga sp. P9-11]|jgi:MFS family permease|uniref:YbfB/YjiJ family MFS transporter n=1 Tax=Tardiphaga sp. P9-11 TaxID=2024614 RepID=UPI0011F1F723|nr:YbfB/YjiJ family MFS transporter [Tardiphaga sp. P9-11]KAA0074711.1 YbfB/YjiJ family MFS transporter [Tardiphaga sp. P9-11]